MNLHKLKNGARVILTPLEETKAVTVLVLFKVGSRYETKKINGISHFIEHIMFKGTKKRPTTLHISKELDGVGAEFNAFTGKDHTGYYIKINHERIEMALDMLSDMILNSKFDEKEIEREKGVIIEEINMYEDNPLMYVDDLFEQVLYSGSKLGWQIAGSRKTVSATTRKDMVDYKNKYYAPEGTVISIAGKMNEKTLSLVEKYFSALKPSKTKYNFQKFDKLTKEKVKIQHKETRQVQLALGFPGYDYHDKRIYALQLLSTILGGNMSSRLFISVRERRGLAYFVRSGVNAYQDTGNLMIQAGLDKDKIDSAIKLILKELEKIRGKGPKDEEVKRAKEYLRGKTILSLEDSSSLSEWYGKQELLTDKFLSPEEKFEKLFAVNASDIKKVAEDIIDGKKLRMALIGSFKETGRFEKILKI